MTQAQINLIQEARKEVAKRTGDMCRSGIDVYFNVNKATGIVVCIRKYKADTDLDRAQVGVSRCARDDRFITPIGQLIALCRASGKSIPNKFLHAGF